MNSTPSIGSLGTTLDQTNQRVKILHGEVMTSAEEIHFRLAEDVARNNSVARFLDHHAARFTARVLGRGISHVEPFLLAPNVAVSEEARIRTSLGLDIIYLGGNRKNRLDTRLLAAERQLALAAAAPHTNVGEPNVVFERLTNPSPCDVVQLLEMYKLCFTSYLVPIDEALVRGAAANSIFYVARDSYGRIVASSIGEHMRVGPSTLLEVSEEAAHPKFRIKGAASGCARRVVSEGKRTLGPTTVAFWEARMWRNILGMSQQVGLTEFGGILHQHCRIASPPEVTSLPNAGEFGSLAVFYSS